MADIIAISGILNTLALLFKNGKREDLVSYGMFQIFFSGNELCGVKTGLTTFVSNYTEFYCLQKFTYVDAVLPKEGSIASCMATPKEGSIASCMSTFGVTKIKLLRPVLPWSVSKGCTAVMKITSGVIHCEPNTKTDFLFSPPFFLMPSVCNILNCMSI